MTTNAEQPKPKSADTMTKVILADGRYSLDAFEFLHEALESAVQKFHSEETETGKRHVSGHQLCESLRELAIERWGPLARTVLKRWRINATIDFGKMVYMLVENSFMTKTEEDSVEDFRDAYDFDQAFRVQTNFKLKE
ncbi:MAG: hypothetical protein HQ546_07650 [Planctomycetes bacterium]|nr:hypothetical protein [Planctomycetota bacterium]